MAGVRASCALARSRAPHCCLGRGALAGRATSWPVFQKVSATERPRRETTLLQLSIIIIVGYWRMYGSTAAFVLARKLLNVMTSDRLAHSRWTTANNRADDGDLCRLVQRRMSGDGDAGNQQQAGWRMKIWPDGARTDKNATADIAGVTVCGWGAILPSILCLTPVWDRLLDPAGHQRIGYPTDNLDSNIRDVRGYPQACRPQAAGESFKRACPPVIM